MIKTLLLHLKMPKQLLWEVSRWPV